MLHVTTLHKDKYNYVAHWNIDRNKYIVEAFVHKLLCIELIYIHRLLFYFSVLGEHKANA